MVSSIYADIRSTVDTSGVDQRVEVNQRALIDKILARYASAGAVYRELLQNSNDAEATASEIYFTKDNNNNMVTEVRYRNNGMPFRPQDWSRLQKIAEGNPDVAKVGAFGVGAYTMFSICEEPLVISGSQALAFVWKGDALWCKVAPSNQPKSPWTTFCLPSRDPYALPDLAEFGKFLCASITFTQCLREIRVFVNDTKRLVITKETLQEPRFVEPPKSTSWWKNDGAVTSTPQGLFSLKNGIWESKQVVKVVLDGQSATTMARYVSGTATTRIPPDMSRRMHRVTKKNHPKQVTVHVLLGGQGETTNGAHAGNKAHTVTSSFAPAIGKGRIFIGFRTSQTTGLAAHLAAPLIPTVEREAIDLQDPTLRVYNTELLEFGGIVLRLMLEHSMYEVGLTWLETKDERDALEKRLLNEASPQADDESVANKEKKKKKKEEEPKQKSTGKSLFAFAKYMAKGVTKGIVNVIQTTLAEDILLKPRDVLPLTTEERTAILLMQSFCPQPSTPDMLVGTALAQGFSRCLAHAAPPVLTRSGVVRGDVARLPHLGMEQFVRENIIRRVVYNNAQEYHDVLAGSRVLTMDDLIQALQVNDPMEQEQAIRLVQWWFRFISTESQHSFRGEQVKAAVRFVTTPPDGQVVSLDRYLYYADKKKIPVSLPFPESVLPHDLQTKIGTRVFSNQGQHPWFFELPVDLWAQYLSQHKCMTAAQPEDEPTRLLAWKTLGQAWLQKSGNDKSLFGKQLHQLFSEQRCLPFDSSEPVPFSAEKPVELYLSSAELQAFDGIGGGSFMKVSSALEVTEEFLLTLGVRKSVSIDFLFANLGTLRWSDDPKPLVEYLRTASLTSADIDKLRSSQYLPAEADDSRTFAPSELYIPNPGLRVFPFVKLLQWPDELPPQSANGRFLQKIGVNLNPPLYKLLRHVSRPDLDEGLRKTCLEYLVKHLGNGGAYQSEYARMRVARLMEFPFLPTVFREVFVAGGQKRLLQAPPSCYSDPQCLVMGFSVLDPDLESGNSNVYGTRFRCPYEPDPNVLATQLTHLVATAKSQLTAPSATEKLAQYTIKAFAKIFAYLSSRSNEFDKATLASLKQHEFIPCLEEEKTVVWFKPDDVYFRSAESKDSLTSELFNVIEFSPFLAAAGVKSDPTIQDLFRLMISGPQKMLDKLGSEEKYKTLLRRMAANPPFRRVTPNIQNVAFLLAYKIVEEENGEEKRIYKLAKACDIFIIDNSFYGRVFPVLRAPQESDLENFYHELGSHYISKQVHKTFEVIGKTESRNTEVTRLLAERIRERTPLLVSPSVTSRPLVHKAASLLDSERLTVYQVENLKAVYSLGRVVRNQRVTCCAKTLGKKSGLYVIEDFDWFDVGFAIGTLILQRCKLEDAFFISSLLQAPLEQLRSRGFPVDRVLSPAQPEPAPVVKPASRPPEPAIPPQAENPSRGASSPPTAQPPKPAKDGKDTILQQMFPDCDADFIKKQLGSNPSMDTVRKLAEQLADGQYPRQQNGDESKSPKNQPTSPKDSGTKTDEVPPSTMPPMSEKKKRALGKRFGKALSGIRNNIGNAAATGGGVRGASPSHHDPLRLDRCQPVPPAVDASSQKGLEGLLRNTVGQSGRVNARGMDSSETVMTEIPDGLSRDPSGCEIVPAQSLKPFSGQYRNGKTHNGIRVFSARSHQSSEAFLKEHFHAVDQFGDVLENLCAVYSLEISSVAIFHDPTGGTIAFNARRALHFNIRFFFALHYSQNMQSSRECYSYWFTTMAHELAHHLVTAHNKEHGYYTESYVTMYLPQLLSLLSRLESRQGSKALLASKFTK